MKAELSACVKDGYAGKSNNNLWSSPCWLAHRAGAYMNESGLRSPLYCSMSRGYAVNVSDGVNKYKITFDKKSLSPMSIEQTNTYYG